MKLLGKVDRLPPFLLEMAHAEGAWKKALYLDDCLVAGLGQSNNR
jgi:hypothetical protein